MLAYSLFFIPYPGTGNDFVFPKHKHNKPKLIAYSLFISHSKFHTSPFRQCWLIAKFLSRMLAYSNYLSLYLPYAVIREITVCNPFKTKQTKQYITK